MSIDISSERSPEARLDDQFAALATTEQERMTEARGLVGGLAPDVRGVWDTIEKHMSDAASQSGTIAHQLQQLKADDMSNPVGVRARIRELQAKAPAEVNGRYDAAAVAIQDVLPALLLTRALPQMPDDSQRRAEAIEEVRMLLGGKSGAVLITAMNALARSGDRRHAAVVTGSWGLARLGGDTASHEAVRMSGVLGAVDHGTPSEKAHANAYGRLSTAALKALTIARTRSARRLQGHAG